MEGVRQRLNPNPLPKEKRPATETAIAKFPHSPYGCGSLLRRPEENETNDNSALLMQFQVQVSLLLHTLYNNWPGSVHEKIRTA